MPMKEASWCQDKNKELIEVSIWTIFCFYFKEDLRHVEAEKQNKKYHSKSCHMATNVNITHTLSSFLRDPPRGMYMYLKSYLFINKQAIVRAELHEHQSLELLHLTSHLLKEACQFFQKLSKL